MCDDNTQLSNFFWPLKNIVSAWIYHKLLALRLTAARNPPLFGLSSAPPVLRTGSAKKTLTRRWIVADAGGGEAVSPSSPCSPTAGKIEKGAELPSCAGDL